MKCVLRVDASIQIGSGHVMRCLTLAEALRAKGAEVLFVSRQLPGHLHDLIERQGVALCRLPAPAQVAARLDWNRHAAWLEVPWQQDAQETLACLQRVDGAIDWLVVDHYALDQQWEKRVRARVGNIMVIDDLADRVHDCDLLLDQNLYQDANLRYTTLVNKECRLLLGPKYALLRDEFPVARRPLADRDGKIRRVLIFYGGADPGRETIKALEAFESARLTNVEADVVVGATNPAREEIRSWCARRAGLRYHCQISNMAELMASADLMLCAGGTTTWERCALGLPGVVTATAGNQEMVAEQSARSGLSFYLGRSADVTTEQIANVLVALSCSPQCLQMYSVNGLAVVDAAGAKRVVGALCPPEIALRLAGPADCDSLYEWRNAEETRRHIFDREPIPLEDHRRWYRAALDNPDRILLIGEIDGEPAGVLRYDLTADKALVSIYLVPGRQGQGVGSELIRTGSCWLRQNRPAVRSIVAEILRSNAGSLRAFEQAGYDEHHRTYEKVLQ
ncbi:MAG: UDP-2,4-diacetamido-2,4,6-trideoxy-beta-L-altropyranose hydrolase [Desulfuromonadales bacterium]|nr:UDP-2,4-diacetamido-2,4,6-trideoxy-beta-L-altropyranose hydrolase [Desulfuromonadales bacterium]